MIYVYVESLNSYRLTSSNSVILDSQISAKSNFPTFEPHNVRLNGRSWCSLDNNEDYLQIDLGNFYKIEIIVTKGRLTLPLAYVKSYYLDYSFDAANWKQAKIKDETRASILYISKPI